MPTTVLHPTRLLPGLLAAAVLTACSDSSSPSPTAPAVGTAYYIDCESGGPGEGPVASPPFLVPERHTPPVPGVASRPGND